MSKDTKTPVLGGLLEAAAKGGITLRDFFAGLAMHQMLRNALDAPTDSQCEKATGILPHASYVLADSMLEERDLGPMEAERLYRLHTIGELAVADWCGATNPDASPLREAIENYLETHRPADQSAQGKFNEERAYSETDSGSLDPVAKEVPWEKQDRAIYAIDVLEKEMQERLAAPPGSIADGVLEPGNHPAGPMVGPKRGDERAK